jgi:superfamily II DNA or RNA helicase
MSGGFKGWTEVARVLASEAGAQRQLAPGPRRLNDGQCASLEAISQRLPRSGVLIADEVGMGKTRIAVAAAHAVVKSGGRVAILVPPGVGFQWLGELRSGALAAPPLLRSLAGFLGAFAPDREGEATPWWSQPVVLVSHAFTNWRLRESSSTWRWTLLPELIAAWTKRRTGRFPNGYHAAKAKILTDDGVRHAVASIVASADVTGSGSLLEKLVDTVSWAGSLDPSRYTHSEDYRPWLEHAVGLGLGIFDLVIVDEAHKARGDDSGLSRLLSHVVVINERTRRLGMTATPVELNVEQWKQTLSRLGLNSDTTKGLAGPIENFAEAIGVLRRSWQVSEDARRSYKQAASEFQAALSPYLIRRDKREDPAVALFAAQCGGRYHGYRKSDVIEVAPQNLTPEWKEAVCAAEALSVVLRDADDPVAKRLRLTFGNGHGVANVLDQGLADAKRGTKQIAVDNIARKTDGKDTIRIEHDRKRLDRGEFWNDVIGRVLKDEPEMLYAHPALTAAVASIEESVEAGEKVLVFGRFTKPMEALVALLNARALIRHVQEQKPWPQQKIHETARTATEFALKQLGASQSLEVIDRKLGAGYKSLESSRRAFRDRLVQTLDKNVTATHGPRAKAIVDALKRGGKTLADAEFGLSLLSRALLELRPQADGVMNGAEVAGAFSKVVDAGTDREAITEGDDDDLDPDAGEHLWKSLAQHLASEYDTHQAGFAKLMHGETKPEARRLMQLAFNRPHSALRVLVAQSVVGREGLNLHESCRIVVLLHHEWNPGVAEQQIGRVDRLESRWAKALSKALSKGRTVTEAELPRIEVRHVVFKGTYDEHHWTVLRQRWDDLRAQLHGEVIPARDSEALSKEELRILAELSAAAPNFSPSPKSPVAKPRRD